MKLSVRVVMRVYVGDFNPCLPNSLHLRRPLFENRAPQSIRQNQRQRRTFELATRNKQGLKCEAGSNWRKLRDV